jgi:hypothetical protein
VGVLTSKQEKEKSMAKIAAWGVGKSLNSRDAARDAVQQALTQMDTNRPALVLAFISVGLDEQEAVNGISDILPKVPLWGLSTLGPLSPDGEEGRSIVVGLIGGSKLEASGQWWPEKTLAQPQQVEKIFRQFGKEQSSASGLLLALDGLGLHAESVLNALGDFPAPLAAALGSGDFHNGKTWQFFGERSGEASAAALVLGGRLRMGVGMGHGWHAVGVSFAPSGRSGALGVQLLNGVPATEALAQVFQHPAREWSYPPLKDLARLYALGFGREGAEGEGLLLRSAVQVEVDGSLRMNAPCPEEARAQLLVGNLENCVTAARQAAETAMTNLGPAKPLLAVLLVDIAWQYLFESRSRQFIAAVGEVLSGIPVVGAYTLGQAASQAAETVAVLQNQHVQVIVLGEAEA